MIELQVIKSFLNKDTWNEFRKYVDKKTLTKELNVILDILDTYVKVTYPDLRSCIKLLQTNSVDGKLLNPRNEDSGVSDYKVEMVELFKKGKIKEARQLLCSKAPAEDMESIFRWCYDNLDLFGDTEEKKDSAVLIIKQGLVDNSLCADHEINLSATLIKLARLQ